MGLATKIVVRKEIPHEPGEWMDFKMLSRKQLEDAERTRRFDSYAEMREMGRDFYEAIIEGNREKVVAAAEESGVDQEEVEAARRDPMSRYDAFTLLRHGLKDWSYDEKLNDANRAELDYDTSDWAAREILKLSRPDLFEDEAEQGNAGTPATG